MLKTAIGDCRRVTVTCISETGWKDQDVHAARLEAGGGHASSQWKIPWDPANALGSCALIEVQALDGRRRRILLDAGWNPDYIEACFRREGVDRLLNAGEIEFLFLSHEHLDHFGGLEAVLRHAPGITIVIPETFTPEGLRFIAGAAFPAAGVRNTIPHQGELVRLAPGQVVPLFEGCAAMGFDLPIILEVRGEQALFFDVAQKGLVAVTGCCHQTPAALARAARSHFAGGQRLYGLYGGLHLAPYGTLSAEGAAAVDELGTAGWQRIACNHCTGEAAVARMLSAGYPIVRGSGRRGSHSDLYVGNGDQVVFG